MTDINVHEDDVNIDETDQDLTGQATAAKTRAQRLGLPMKGSDTAATATAVSSSSAISSSLAARMSDPKSDERAREESRKARFGTQTAAEKAAAREQRFLSNTPSNGASTNKSSLVRGGQLFLTKPTLPTV